MNPNREINQQRNIVMGKASDLFNKYFHGDIAAEKFKFEFDEIMDSYDRNVYATELSISVRKRLTVFLTELKLNPINMKYLNEFSREVGIGFTFEDGWYVLGESKEKNSNFMDLGDEKIDF